MYAPGFHCRIYDTACQHTSLVAGNARQNLTGPLRLATLPTPKEDTSGCVVDFLDKRISLSEERQNTQNDSR